MAHGNSLRRPLRRHGVTPRNFQFQDVNREHNFKIFSDIYFLYSEYSIGKILVSFSE
jgi:hypothetical protein